jgi:hypothetical protein
MIARSPATIVEVDPVGFIVIRTYGTTVIVSAIWQNAAR